MPNSTGKIAQVIGPVVDVAFPINDNLPEINNALTITRKFGSQHVLEVALELGDGAIRIIAWHSTGGWARGMSVGATCGRFLAAVV